MHSWQGDYVCTREGPSELVLPWGDRALMGVYHVYEEVILEGYSSF